MNKLTLVELVEQFIYTHPLQHHKKELLTLIRDVEEEYLRRIVELENDRALGEFNRMVSEGSPNDSEDDRIELDDLRGTRYYGTDND